MPSRSSNRLSRKTLLYWATCAAVSVLLIATPPNVRRGIASALEWSVFLPVRAVLGWDDRSLFLSRENRRLQKDLTSGEIEISRLGDTGHENEALRRMLGMRERSRVGIVPARVVGRSIDWPGEILWVSLSGSASPGMAVVSTDGLIGRVSRVTGDRALIETVWHSRVAVSVLDGRSREQGILHWESTRPQEFAIDPVPLQSDFRPGDPIITSGLGEVFPSGIRVGYVLGTEPDPRTQLKRVRVRPSADRGRAQNIFVVEERAGGADASALFPEPRTTRTGPPPFPGGPEATP
jgi:rod shape-determining protein MreC